MLLTYKTIINQEDNLRPSLTALVINRAEDFVKLLHLRGHLIMLAIRKIEISKQIQWHRVIHKIKVLKTLLLL